MVRLIATDLDGTLLEPDGTLPEGIFEVIEALNGCGIRFAASSGRQYGNLARLFASAASRMAFVCENGAFCVLTGQEAGTIVIPNETAMEIIEDIERLHMNLLISGKHTCYMLDQNRKYTDDIVYRLRNTVTMISSVKDITEPILKISGQIDTGVASLAPALLEKWGNRLTATVSGRDWFDFTIANKGMGMEKLVQHMGIQKEEVAAFGDNFNDETMLDYVGYPFVMESAHPALRKPHYHTCKKVLSLLREIAAAKGDMDQVIRKING
ncbi:MAG: HAD-IIB family hydrolase [Clostridia bacterium]|nr:HAD-IIB family hydrolase [Clostridia bacterium]